MNTTKDDTIVCLLDGSRGMYLAKDFADYFDTKRWGISGDDAAILSSGPDHDDYDYVWDEVTADAQYTDDYGHTWTLWMDGDLFAVREDHVWDDE